MNEHVTSMLGAHMDGELTRRTQERVEAHLAICAACRQALADLQALSALLQAYPTAEPMLTQERFVSQVGLRLSERAPSRTAVKFLKLGWHLVPLFLLSVWVGLQVLSWMGRGFWAIVLLALPDNVGALLEPYLKLLPFGRPLFGVFSRALPAFWARATLFQYVSVLFIGLLACSWLASWWVIQRQSKGT